MIKKFLPENNPDHVNHTFNAVELPDLAGGLPVHRIRCVGCMTVPIIGYRFICAECPNLNLCQKCFFKKKEPRSHKYQHDIRLIWRGR